MGCATPIGDSVPTFWQGLLSGASGVRQLLPVGSPDEHHEEMEASDSFNPFPHAKLFDQDFLQSCGTSFASVIGYPLNVDRRDQREMSLFMKYAQHASLEALGQANLLDGSVDPSEMAVIMGTGVGALEDLGETQLQISRGVSSFDCLACLVGRVLMSRCSCSECEECPPILWAGFFPVLRRDGLEKACVFLPLERVRGRVIE